MIDLLSLNNNSRLSARDFFLTMAFLHSEGITIDASSLCYGYAYDYVEQIDMNDGKGFQTWKTIPIDGLELALAKAKKLRLKRKYRQRVVRRDYFTTVIDPKKIKPGRKRHEDI